MEGVSKNHNPTPSKLSYALYLHAITLINPAWDIPKYIHGAFCEDATGVLCKAELHCQWYPISIVDLSLRSKSGPCRLGSKPITVGSAGLESTCAVGVRQVPTKTCP